MIGRADDQEVLPIPYLGRSRGTLRSSSIASTREGDPIEESSRLSSLKKNLNRTRRVALHDQQWLARWVVLKESHVLCAGLFVRLRGVAWGLDLLLPVDVGDKNQVLFNRCWTKRSILTNGNGFNGELERSACTVPISKFGGAGGVDTVRRNDAPSKEEPWRSSAGNKAGWDILLHDEIMSLSSSEFGEIREVVLESRDGLVDVFLQRKLWDSKVSLVG